MWYVKAKYKYLKAVNKLTYFVSTTACNGAKVGKVEIMT